MTIQAMEKAIENLEYKVAKLEFEVYEQRRTIGQLIMEKADRKTENSSEIPNNCETCLHAGECDWEPWQECPYEPKTEPQKMCDAYCNEDCIECAKETELWKAEQTDCSWK